MIYYYPWRMELRAGLTVEGLRARFASRTEIVDPDEAKDFYRSSPIDRLKPAPEAESKDVRLVIDLELTGGMTVTYFATYLRLYSRSTTASGRRSRFECGDEV